MSSATYNDVLPQQKGFQGYNIISPNRSTTPTNFSVPSTYSIMFGDDNNIWTGADGMADTHHNDIQHANAQTRNHATTQT
jgi:hypothetical protein